MSEALMMIITAFAVLLLCLAFIVWVFITRSDSLNKLHDEVIDETTSPVLDACLAYGQSQLTAMEYEKFKTLLTAEITTGEGGINLARLVERCIEQARGVTE